ncbi:methyl-accepting chemotaxis protein [Amphibiibacter pelophylacis]|uniref:Methyl-accepting chemotaxis protein n=1 Tax=Amphibiibacter pelophylacis TaxID=1799477 RepID=A0ACC6P3T1_9BURK
MKISTRLALGYALILAICLSVFVFAALRMTTLAGDVDEVAGSRLTQVSELQDLRNSLNAQGHQVRNILISPDSTFQAAEFKKATDRVGSNRKLIADLKDRPRTQEGLDMILAIEKLEPAFSTAMLRTGELAMQGQPDAARASLLGEMRDRQMPLFKAVDDALALQLQRATALAESSRAQATQSAWMMGWLGLVAALVSLGALWQITRYISRAIGGEPADVNGVIQRIASGDLRSIDAVRKAHAGSVLATLGDMQTSLAQIVAQVRTSSDSIATGSTEIASGNADLSQRTEQQASSLQQTTATMEQISTTLRANAETAGEATSLAAQAAQAAQQGGEVVGAVVCTMQEISSSSQKIADIIGVIDSIAFQTNILALNAAVEAARAGEQGRGFAVVASEVRSLAQRSAEAAKEIKALINASVDKVATGAQQVDLAGTSMTEIVSQVQRVSVLITEISAATAQQSQSISGVSQAVGQLDTVTQQNAALVEESAAAAESLRQQADRLLGAVSTFKLADGPLAVPAAGASAPRPAAAAAATQASSPARPAAAAPAPHSSSRTPEPADAEWATF